MSREQLSEQQALHDGREAHQDGAQAETHGLPPYLYGKAASIQPGDVVGLRNLLTIYPDFSQAILAVASPRAGLSTVQQAVEMVSHNAVGHRPGLTQDQIRPGGEFALEGGAPTVKPATGKGGSLTQDQIRPGGEFALEGGAPTVKPAVGGSLTQAQIRPGGEFELEGGPPTVKPAVGGSLTQEQIRPGGEFELEGGGPTVKPATGKGGSLTQAQIRPGGEFELEGGGPTVKPAVGGSLTQDQIRPGGEFELEESARKPAVGGSLTQAQIRPGGEFELEGSTPTVKPAVGGSLTQAQIRPGGEFELEGGAPTVKPATGKGGSLTQEQIRPGGEFELEGNTPTVKPATGKGGSLTQAQIRPGGEFELEGGTPTVKPATGKGGSLTQDQIRPGGELELEETKQAPKPDWVVGAATYNAAHAALAAEFNQLTDGACLDEAGQLDPELVADWQKAHAVSHDGRVGPKTVEAAKGGGEKQAEEGPVVDGATRDVAAEHAPKAEEDWKPSTAKTETKLTGTYGEYAVKHGFAYDATDGWSYEVEITMTAGEKATAEKIGWVQVVRRSKGASAGWATGKDDQGMTEERAKRTDDKTGFRVDRVSAPEKKTPFYGMSKGADGKLNAASNTVIGKHGGANPYLYDGPGLYDKDEVEFVSTATGLDDGAQYDAIHWGAKYDKDGKIATETTPTCVAAGDALLAGRDRAVSKWNTDIAKGDIDKVPGTVDPAATAKTLSGQLGGMSTDEASVTKTLKETTDPDLRKRIQAAYKVETGRELAADLKAELSKEALVGLDAWL